MKALITGGTGTLGRLVVSRLRDAGGDIRVLSRRQPDLTEGIEYVTGDLATGRESMPRSRERRLSSTARAARRATGTRPGTWCARRRGAEPGTL